MNILDKIPDHIRIYLQEIAEKMNQGKAVVMVGSGFSKNAEKYRDTPKTFLDWNQLGSLFYKKLYGRRPEDEEKPYYYNDVLKLADKVQQCFGRTDLDRILLDNLPDEEYNPSALHIELLKLNWKDVFTTNYDTLLERARTKVFNRRYQVVLSKEDLVYSKCPRIIKLHGSFPSTRPFIVTEEDYRKYPRDNAVFVNTVRQALIENVMCMVGFSGDDPNFLNWIGWIRDNLGKESSSKIYLIGVFDVKEVDLKLYNYFNIVPINMKDCQGIECSDYRAGFELFFSALHYFQCPTAKEQRASDYEKEIKNIRDLMSKGFLKEKEKTKGIIQDWENERKRYPGWLIMPYKWRKRIEATTRLVCSQIRRTEIDEIDLGLEGAFLFELDWRRRQILLPMRINEKEVYGEYLEKKGYKRWNTKDIILCFSLLEYLREHGEFEEWNKLVDELGKINDNEARKRLYFEKMAKYLYCIECDKLFEQLVECPKEWPTSKFGFLYAGLWAELGYYEKMLHFLQDFLNDTRMQMGDDISYQYYSIEAYLMELLEYAEKYEKHLKYKSNESNDAYNLAHLKELKSYDCCPDFERDYLMEQLVLEHYTEKGEREYNFVEGDDSYRYIKMMERTGMIFRSWYGFNHVEEFPALLKSMVNFNPYLTLICTFRYGDIKACKIIWCDETVKKLETNIVDRLIKLCLNACKENERYISKKGTKNSLASMIPLLSPSIVTVLSKNVSKSSKGILIEFISYTLKNPQMKFCFGKEMISTVIHDLSQSEVDELFEELIDLPLGCEIEDNGKKYLFEPLIYLDSEISISSSLIEKACEKIKMIKTLKEEMQIGQCLRILALEKYNTNRNIGNEVWEKVNENTREYDSDLDKFIKNY